MQRDEGQNVLCAGGAATLSGSAREVGLIYEAKLWMPPTGYELGKVECVLEHTQRKILVIH